MFELARLLLIGLLLEFLCGYFIGCLVGYGVGTYKEEWSSPHLLMTLLN